MRWLRFKANPHARISQSWHLALQLRDQPNFLGAFLLSFLKNASVPICLLFDPIWPWWVMRDEGEPWNKMFPVLLSGLLVKTCVVITAHKNLLWILTNANCCCCLSSRGCWFLLLKTCIIRYISNRQQSAVVSENDCNRIGGIVPWKERLGFVDPPIIHDNEKLIHIRNFHLFCHILESLTPRTILFHHRNKNGQIEPVRESSRPSSELVVPIYYVAVITSQHSEINMMRTFLTSRLIKDTNNCSPIAVEQGMFD